MLTLRNKATLLLVGLLLVWLLWDAKVEDSDRRDPLRKRPSQGLQKQQVIDYESFKLMQTKACPLHEIHPNRPPIQYGIMIDAGSSGSRVHIYRLNFCNSPTPQLEDEVFEQLKPGLSSYANDPVEAAKSLDPLLDIAVKSVPSKLQSCTPISVKATAGLRVLGMKKSEDILDAVRDRLLKKYPFKIAQKGGVEVMDGKDEGVFAWITVNYLLDNLGKRDKPPTAAIMDLGGGSTQIVFEPVNVPLQPGDHKYILKYGGHEYTLYQHSYLGYGLNEGRHRVKGIPVTEDMRQTEELEEILHPCFPKRYEEIFESTEIKGTQGGFEKCYEFITTSDQIFKKNPDICITKPCSFDGVYQPSIQLSFPSPHEIYAFSFFYDRTQPLKPVPHLSVGEIRKLGEQVCNLSLLDNEVRENPHYCLDLVFMYALLKRGYGIEDVRTLKLTKKIKGIETGWCLGSTLLMVEEELAGKEGEGLTELCLAGE